MDPERPHRSTSINNSSSSNSNTSTTSELFICFTSRLSSSSMKISSKSILSPGRAREPSQNSLSSSLSRRLRSNGSMKGGQASPMFPTNGKKRGCGFENPEPSSPKVTCIGQVRVKTKKQSKKFRACRSKRRGEVSFRKVEHNNVNNGSNSVDGSSSQDFNMGHFLSNNNSHLNHHHQQQQQQQQQQECKKWVHLPMTICEALRAFGAEFNCFLPCRSSCMAKEERNGGSVCGNNNGNGNVSSSSSSCGAVFARWLVAVQEGEGKEREIELVVGGEDDDERRESSEMLRRSQRRHVFEDIEINDCGIENVGDEEEARVSICIPPKNALLLMRCRSDPVKMAALANKFWENPAPKTEIEEEEEEEAEAEAENANVEKDEKEEEKVEKVEKEVAEVEREGRKVQFVQEMEHQEVSEVSDMFVSCEATEEQETIPEVEADAETEEESVLMMDEREVAEESMGRSLTEKPIIEFQDQEHTNVVAEEENQEESKPKEETFAEVSLDLDQLQMEEIALEAEQENEHHLEGGENATGKVEEVHEEEEQEEMEDQAIAEEAGEEEDEEDESSSSTAEEKGGETAQERPDLECPETREPDPEDESKETESQQNLLPDCLLLMMCEPKLSMEVSKETWVCSRDFIRWTPEKKKQPPVKQKNGGDEPKRRISIDSKPPSVLLQPPRSSCSFPAAPPMVTAAKGGGNGGSMATMIEQKLVGGKGYEPFVLTRCKSEPMRSSTKLAPDACFWKNRKLEPATLGVNAAGVGF